MITTTDSLKELERRAYRSTFADGIYDILFGMVLLIMGLIPVLESAGISRFYGYLLWLIAIPIPWLGKRFITIPRLGAVEFRPKRRSKKWILVMVSATIIFLIMPILVMMSAKGLSDGQLWILVVPIGALLVALGGFFMDFPRLYLYAVILVYGIMQSEFLLSYIGRPLNSLISLGIPGVAILIFGLTLLSGFMKKYPKPNAEASHAG